MAKTELRKEWKHRVNAFVVSGQSASEWCAANNLRLNRLRYWLRKFKQIEPTAGLQPQWLTLEIGSDCGSSSLLVKVGQSTIEVKQGFNPRLLVDVVRALTALC